MMKLEDCLSQNEYESCPGRYCARVVLNESLCLFSECQRCPRGFRPNDEYNIDICRLCENEASLYDYMYLVFMLNVVILFNLVSIDRLFERAQKRHFEFSSLKIAIVYIMPALENILGLITTILVFSPYGSLKLHSCLVHSFYDWYSIFFDPYIDFFKKLSCSQEIVYPLYSLVIVYLLFSTMIMLILRLPVAKFFLKDEIYKKIQSKSIFATLHSLPIFIIIHLIGGGLLYYSFPTITIIGLILSNNFYLSKIYDYRISQKNYLKQTALNTFKLLKVPRNLTTLLIHWYLMIFGIISLTQFENGLVDLFYFLLIPGPFLFYIISFKYTNPKNI